MATYTPNFNLYMPDPTDPLEDFRAEHNNNMQIIDQNLGGGGGGGGGGVSNFTETVLATASSFSDMTVDFSTAYDAFVFYANDATFQKAESYFFTRSEITDAINNNFAISLYPFGSAGICQYYITRSGLTRANNSAGFFIYKIVGLNFGSTPHIYSTSEQVIGTWIDGKPIYQRVITGLSIGQNTGASYTIPKPSPDLKQIIDSTLMSTLTQYKTVTHPPTWITDSSNLAIRSQEADTYDTFIIDYTKTTD